MWGSYFRQKDLPPPPIKFDTALNSNCLYGGGGLTEEYICIISVSWKVCFGLFQIVVQIVPFRDEPVGVEVLFDHGDACNPSSQQSHCDQHYNDLQQRRDAVSYSSKLTHSKELNNLTILTKTITLSNCVSNFSLSFKLFWAWSFSMHFQLHKFFGLYRAFLNSIKIFQENFLSFKTCFEANVLRQTLKFWKKLWKFSLKEKKHNTSLG